MKRDIYDRIVRALRRLENSHDVDFDKINVAWDRRDGRKRTFSVECVRLDEDVVDEDGEVQMQAGEWLGFEVYYQLDGRDTDCCTLDRLDDAGLLDLREFVDMYR